MPTTWKTSERVTIGRVRRIEFVRATNPLDVWIAIDRVTNRKRIVTRYAETVFDALIRNSLDDIVNYRCHFCSHYSFLKLSKIEISDRIENFSWTRSCQDWFASQIMPRMKL